MNQKLWHQTGRKEKRKKMLVIIYNHVNYSILIFKDNF